MYVAMTISLGFKGSGSSCFVSHVPGGHWEKSLKLLGDARTDAGCDEDYLAFFRLRPLRNVSEAAENEVRWHSLQLEA